MRYYKASLHQCYNNSLLSTKKYKYYKTELR